MLNNEQTEQLVKAFLEIVEAKNIKIFSLSYDLEKVKKELELVKKELEDVKKGK